MPAKTQNLGTMLNTTDDLYEAAIVIARRCRQINEEYYQKKRDHQILEELDGGFDDDFLAMEQEEAETKVMAETEENPITIAMRDFYAGKLAYHYDSPRK
ncbi:MAG: DNA-directed RNA polymerase subunit omega [Calditrichaeota bacterium]|nr:DNA-directed RNA polymerase subunit omega [Calditrichota bacterium]MCB0266591.1 DNA-directed RNA polymerase subunit omega [Calditrichota bacterium]MCB0299076.1 DNA-directed RNA polymerase subunit omega [Calditrichota bacterium]MCB9068192.1 DNA-directed RNA polymerase subunit omega [Calditrichia bacterium]